MAKNVKSNLDGEKSKHGNKCCTCCLVFIIIAIIFVGAAFGVGWYFGDKYSREYLGMPLGDALGVVSDLYGASDKDVVNNPYSDEDLDGFYSELKRNVMLKESADIDFDEALDLAIDEFIENGGAAQVQAAAKAKEKAGQNGDDGDTENGEPSVIDIVVNMLTNVLTRENIDIEKLNAYDENDPSTDTYILNLKDKQLAAFVNHVATKLLGNEKFMDFVMNGSSDSAFVDNDNILSYIDLSRSVAVKQVNFTTEKETENGEEKVKSTRVDLTLWVGLQDAAGQALRHFATEQGFGWASGLVKFAGDLLLPKNMYVTVSLPLYGEGKAQVSLNKMNERERQRAYKLIDSVLSLNSGEGDDVQTVDGLLTQVTDEIKPFLESAADIVPFDKIENGAIKLDLLGTAANMISEQTEGEPITKADCVYVLQTVFSDPTERLKEIEPFRFENVYLQNGKEVYLETPPVGGTPIDYDARFISDVADKYMLNIAADTTVEELFAMFGIDINGNGEPVEQPEIMDLIDGTKLNAVLDRNINELKVNVTDKMLGSILSGVLDGFMDDADEMLARADIKLDAFTFSRKVEKPANLYATLVVEANIADMIEMDDARIQNLIRGLFPDSIILTVTIDITRSRPAGATPDPVSLIFNSSKNTDRALAVISKFAPDFDISEMTGKISDTVNEVLDNIDKMLPVSYVPNTVNYDSATGSWTGNNGALVFPDIFTVVSDFVLVDDNGNKVLGDDGANALKNVMKGLSDTSGFGESDPAINNGYSAFITDVTEKYYIDGGSSLTTFDELTAFMSDFDTSKFRIYSDAPRPGVNYLATDTRSASSLKPVMTGAQLGALIKEQLPSGDGEIELEIVEVKTAADSLGVVLGVDIAELIGGNNDILSIITVHTLYVTADIDMAHTVGTGDDTRYPVSVKINNMTNVDYENLLKIVRFFAGDDGFDFESQLAEFGKTLYKQLNSLDTGLGGSDGSLFEFTDRGLELPDVYTFIATHMGVELNGDKTADDVKRALQGLYARGDNNNPANYIESDIIRNIPDASSWTASDAVALNSASGVSDRKFAHYISERLGSTSVGVGVTVEQTAVLAARDNSAKAAAFRNWLASKLPGANISADKDYLAVTFAMDMRKFMQGSADSGAFFPDKVYATVVYEKTRTGDVDTFVALSGGIILNNMTSGDFALLQELMGLSSSGSGSDEVSIDDISSECADIINDLTHNDHGIACAVNFTPSAGDGIGNISVTVSV